MKRRLRATHEAEAGTDAAAWHTAAAAVAVVAGKTGTIVAWAACAGGSRGEGHTAACGGRAQHRDCGGRVIVPGVGYDGSTAAQPAS